MKEIIEKYLNDRCKEDLVLKEKMETSGKTINGCIGFIYGKARKEAKNENTIAIKDEVVFGWAVHYFLEDEILEKDVNNSRHVKVKTNANTENNEDDEEQPNKSSKKATTNNSKNKVKEKQKEQAKDDYMQLTLF